MVNVRLGGPGDPPEAFSPIKTPVIGDPFSSKNVARHRQELGDDVRATIVGQLAALKNLGGSVDEAYALVEQVFPSKKI